QSPTTPPHPSRRTGLACLRQQAQGADITRESGLTDHAWMACNGALSLSLLDRGRPPSLLPLPLLARSRPWRASSSQVASSSGSPIGSRSSAACRGPSPLGAELDAAAGGQGRTGDEQRAEPQPRRAASGRGAPRHGALPRGLAVRASTRRLTSPLRGCSGPLR